jgi:hypothetical protein
MKAHRVDRLNFEPSGSSILDNSGIYAYIAEHYYRKM